MEESYDVIISSNGAKETHNENTLSSFQVPIGEGIDFKLNQEWSVGVKEIFFPKIWNSSKLAHNLDSIRFMDVDYDLILGEYGLYILDEFYYDYFDKENSSHLNHDHQVGSTNNLKRNTEENIQPFITESRNAMRVNDVKTINTTTKNLKNFIRLCLHHIRDPSFVNLEYFSDFLSPELFFGSKHNLEISGLKSKYDFDDSKVSSEEFKSKHPMKGFPLDLSHLVKKVEEESIFFPTSLNYERNKTLFEKLSLKVYTNCNYNLKTILFLCINKIIANFSFCDLPVKEQKEFFNAICTSRSCEKNSFVDNLMRSQVQVDLLCKRFIRRFVLYAISLSKDIIKDRIKSNFPQDVWKFNSNIFFIYTDVVQTTIINSNKANLLAIVTRDDVEKGWIRFQNVNYVRVSHTFVKEIAIKILTPDGREMPFVDSSTPLILKLNFKRTL